MKLLLDPELRGVSIMFLFLFMTGLCVGSFLNVVISRLPNMMKAANLRFCKQLLTSASEVEASSGYSLAYPGSHCPHCRTPIPWYDNIPLLSWCLLHARCRSCSSKISWRYPCVEMLTAGWFIAIYVGYGISMLALLLLFYGCILISLACIDLETMLLPDGLTLTLLWIGLLGASAGYGLVSPSMSIQGAAIAYLFLSGISYLFYYCSGRWGLGDGDLKLVAAMGAWFGLRVVWYVLIAASILASIYAWCTGKKRTEAFPFGPFLAAVGLLLPGYTLLSR